MGRDRGREGAMGVMGSGVGQGGATGGDGVRWGEMGARGGRCGVMRGDGGRWGGDAG